MVILEGEHNDSPFPHASYALYDAGWALLFLGLVLDEYMELT